MQLVVERGLPPVLLQPTFVICIGGGQVRVAWSEPHVEAFRWRTAESA